MKILEHSVADMEELVKQGDAVFLDGDDRRMAVVCGVLIYEERDGKYECLIQRLRREGDKRKDGD